MTGKINHNHRKIISLSGPRACGKSTISEHLVRKLGYERIAFADPLREIAAVFSIDLKDDRLFLSELGVTVRSLLPDFLIQIVKKKIKNLLKKELKSFIIKTKVYFLLSLKVFNMQRYHQKLFLTHLNMTKIFLNN